MENPNIDSKKLMATALRMLCVDSIEKAKSGHPGLPLGMADVATVLFSDFLNFNPKDPNWINRDRFILSAGHGSSLLYGMLHLTGYDAMTTEQLKNFRQLHSLTPGHPEAGLTPGVEATTGPLGQGLANAVGIALGERMTASKLGNEIIDHFTYALVGDGCLMEGISQEAITLAGHLKLGKLIVLFDDNGITIDGQTNLVTSEDTAKRFEAAGWHCQTIDGHNYDEISKALENAKASEKPSMIACRTTIGFGAPNVQGSNKAHGSPLGAEERKNMASLLNWPHDPFFIPPDIYKNWEKASLRCREAYDNWQKNYSNQKHEQKELLKGFFSKQPTKNYQQDTLRFIEEISLASPKKATRVLSQNCLELLQPHFPGLVGGSADLTGSNNTYVKSMMAINTDNFNGNYINYGIREHAMGAIMNGLSLYGGFIPFGGTFLTFSDYMRPAMRLSALMKLQVIYVLTHDSIGLGEDGPTHQPVEHIQSLRLIPNLYVFRPCDGVETMEAWQAALSMLKAPSVLCLTRQAVPTCRTVASSKNMTLLGGYTIKEANKKPTVILIATGSEVHISLDISNLLEKKGISCRVVSIPCQELFDQQEDSYKKEVLGTDPCLRVSIEAGTTQGWEKYVGYSGLRFGINTFGESAPATSVFNYFGLSAETISDKILSYLNTFSRQ